MSESSLARRIEWWVYLDLSAQGGSALGENHLQ